MPDRSSTSRSRRMVSVVTPNSSASPVTATRPRRFTSAAIACWRSSAYRGCAPGTAGVVSVSMSSTLALVGLPVNLLTTLAGCVTLVTHAGLGSLVGTGCASTGHRNEFAAPTERTAREHVNRSAGREAGRPHRGPEVRHIPLGDDHAEHRRLHRLGLHHGALHREGAVPDRRYRRVRPRRRR